MYLIRSYSFSRRDFTGDLKCEFCSNREHRVKCYDDSYFHQHVIPGIKCKACDKSTSDDPGKVPVQTGPRQSDSVVL